MKALNFLFPTILSVLFLGACNDDSSVSRTNPGSEGAVINGSLQSKAKTNIAEGTIDLYRMDEDNELKLVKSYGNAFEDNGAFSLDSLTGGAYYLWFYNEDSSEQLLIPTWINTQEEDLGVLYLRDTGSVNITFGGDGSLAKPEVTIAGLKASDSTVSGIPEGTYPLRIEFNNSIETRLISIDFGDSNVVNAGITYLTDTLKNDIVLAWTDTVWISDTLVQREPLILHESTWVKADSLVDTTIERKWSLKGSLNVDAAGIGSQWESPAFLRIMREEDDLSLLRTHEGGILTIETAEKFSFSVVVANSATGIDTEITGSWNIEDTDSDGITRVREFVDAFNRWATASAVPAVMTISHTGEIEIKNTGGETISLENLTLEYKGAKGAVDINAAFYVEPKIVHSYTMQNFLVPVQAKDLIQEAFAENGMPLGLEAGDRLDVLANIGEKSMSGYSSLIFNPAVTTLQNLLDMLQESLLLPEKMGSNQTVILTSEGKIQVNGLSGESQEINSILLNISNANESDPAPKAEAFLMTETRKAVYPEQIILVDTITDALNKKHLVQIEVLPTEKPLVWKFQLNAQGLKFAFGDSGSLFFDAKGNFSVLFRDDGSDFSKVVPDNGSAPIEWKFDLKETQKQLKVQTQTHLDWQAE